MKNSKFLLLVAAAAFFAGSAPLVANDSNSPADNTVQGVQQNKTITGKIVDAAGESIIGANVTLKGEPGTGTISNVDGDFTLSVRQGQVLVISYIGYVTQEFTVGAASSYTITLQEDTEMLDEVVVTAMGIRKEKKALGYAVSDVNATELMKNKQTNVINSLAGKIPGVSITQGSGAAGSGASITIRGGNSTSEGRENQPLFIVDGVI
ncbi:MAG: carboxypeptidase-like regulatory domain-containing protein, partial [Prevotellaceae bacterium]|nr:carboxypeptidase-like regulatory domain-containing protein [Prevotellaceae bacterium]